MYRIIFLIACYVFLNGCCSNASSSLNNTCNSYFDNQIKKKVFTTADILPEFEGGYANLFKIFLSNFKYPQDVPLQPTIIFELIIDKNGKVISAKIHKKKETDYTLVDKEGIRVITKFSEFKPGKCNNKPVCYKLILPVKILLKG